MRYVIQKLGRDVKSIVLKFPSDQTSSLRISNEKQRSSVGEMHSNSKKDITIQLYRDASLVAIGLFDC